MFIYISLMIILARSPIGQNMNTLPTPSIAEGLIQYGSVHIRKAVLSAEIIRELRKDYVEADMKMFKR